MSKSNSRNGDKSQKRMPHYHYHCDNKIQYLLDAEEHLLQAISTRAPLPEVLSRICSALDFQIGNVVSLISLPADDASELATIAMNAALFLDHEEKQLAIPPPCG